MPAPAYAADGAVLTPYSIAAGLLALGLAGLSYHLFRRLRAAQAEMRARGADRRQLEAVLAAAPSGYYMWNRVDGTTRSGPGLATLLGVDAVPVTLGARLPSERFAEADDERLEQAIAALHADGTPFRMLLPFADGTGSVIIHGLRIESGSGRVLADLVWFLDASEEAAQLARLTDRAVEAEVDRDSLRVLLDALPVPVWRREADLSLSWVNRAYAEAVDSSREEVLRRGREIAADVIDDRGRALARRAARIGQPQSESHHVVVKGARRLFEFTETPLAETGEIGGFGRDVTDLEATQAELARHIAAHDEVLERLATAIAIYSADRRLKFFNSAFAELWGLNVSWLRTEPGIGDVLEDLRQRRRLPEYVDFRAFKQTQQDQFTSLIEPIEELMHLPDGSTLRQVVSPHPFGGLLFVYEDVTDRLDLERSYNTLIDVQRETLNNLHEGIAVFGGDGRLKLYNPVFAEMWNFSAEDLADEPHIAQLIEATQKFFVVGDDWGDLKDRVIARVTNPEPYTERMERVDGRVLDYALQPLPDGACLVSYLDITDSFKVEKALRERTVALEEADRLKTQFIANVSYELRTPLNAIIGFAELLSSGFAGPLNERQMGYSQGIVDASQKLIGLINDILDLATIEAGFMELEVRPMEIRTAVNEVVSLINERAREHKLTVRTEIPEDAGVISADKRRIKQVLLNLLSNAIQFTPEGGSVTVSVLRGPDEVALTVADSGIGIRSDDQQRVLNMFERGKGHARQAGAGLGLSLVTRFIELHGGRVELESTVDQGTRVTCRLPLHALVALPPPQAADTTDTAAE